MCLTSHLSPLSFASTELRALVDGSLIELVAWRLQSYRPWYWEQSHLNEVFLENSRGGIHQDLKEGFGCDNVPCLTDFKSVLIKCSSTARSSSGGRLVIIAARDNGVRTTLSVRGALIELSLRSKKERSN